MENICYLQMRKIIAIISKINRREAMKKYEIIAVDFDGTLCNDCYPDIGKPNLPLIELLKALKREGCRIVLWTCRCGRELEQAVQWCEEFGLEFDKVNRNTDEILEKYGSDSRKIYADVYIDDKACFPWEVMAYKKEE
jgi:hydroxymethylpyrimidine pyrophosphatase-like HAD family hydrolase